MQETADQIVERAHALLRAHTCADLRFDEHIRPLKYVSCPDGRLAMPVMIAMLQSVDTVLFVPACEEGAMELQVTLEPFEERGEGGAIADRWRIYHGEPEDVRWARVTIDAAKLDGHVIDGDALMRHNTLAAHEPAICRSINAERKHDLQRMCVRFAEVEIEEPTLVGVDDGGFDVRGKFDVHRVPARRAMRSPSDAISHFDELAHEAAST
jgi:hypothetical protein